MALLQKAYLGATPLFRDVPWYQTRQAVLVNASSGASLTANTSAHTKGSWTQVIASTAAQGSWLSVLCTGFNTAATNTASLIDIAIGASGSEVAVISNVSVGGATGLNFSFPVQIPSGSRLSARIQSVVTGGKTGTVNLYVLDAGDYSLSPSSVDVIGTSTADSQGTSFSGASGTWVESIASTSQRYRAVSFVPSIHDADVAANTNSIADIGVGASGSEVTFGNYRFTTNANEFIATAEPRGLDPFGRDIPAGSRLAVKHAITANPSKYGFCLIGIP
jgi:hypothetical protein